MKSVSGANRHKLKQFYGFKLQSAFEPQHEISNNVVCATSKASDQPAHTRSLIRAFACRLSILWVLATDRTSFGVSKLKRGLHRLVWVYTCQNTTLSEITCRGPFVNCVDKVNSCSFTCVIWSKNRHVNSNNNPCFLFHKNKNNKKGLSVSHCHIRGCWFDQLHQSVWWD